MTNFKSIFILIIGFVFSIYSFLYGFLINRSEIYEINSCNTDSNYCKYSPYKRVVLLLVDALNYEFINPNLSKLNFYHGHMSIISSIIKRKPNNVYLSHFVSDPPTTTLQRIKGLTTGSLPTFIDISTNFGSSELFEDNIVNQWLKSGFDIKFVGDNTWIDLFPNKFNVSSSHPSFNIKDLDTVDQKVEQFILKYLSKKPEGTNDHPEVIIGHMLGIDHCGHTYGKNHPQMKRKLMELNHFVEKIIDLVDKDTVFIMFGDHGMTVSGDHGGDSPDEIDSGLFMISGKALNVAKLHSKEEFLSQIDLVPTLAAITGVPIPYSNLGVVKSEMLTSLTRSRVYTEINVKQMAQYIGAYERRYGNLGFSDDIRTFLSQPANQSNNIDHSINMLHRIKIHFQSKWAQFNVPLIYSALSTSVLFLVALCNCVIEARSDVDSRTNKLPIYLVYLVTVLSQFFVIGISNVLFGLLVVFLGLEVAGFYKNRMILFNLFLGDQFSLVIYTIGVLNVMLTFSNSFIVSEDRIMQFFLFTILLVQAIRCLLPLFRDVSREKHQKSSTNIPKFNFTKSISIVFSLMIGWICLVTGLRYKLCREEQRAWCESGPQQPTSGLVSATLFLVPGLTILHHLWLRRCGNLASSTDCNVLIVKYLLSFSAVSSFVFHVAQLTDHQSSEFSEIINICLLYLPRIIIGATSLSLIILVIWPLLILLRKPLELTSGRGSVHVATLFRYLKECQETDKAVTVHGLATVYSSFLFTGILGCCLLVSVFLRIQFVLGLFATIGVLLSYSALVTLSSKIVKGNLFDAISVSETVIFMVVLAQYGFFATGHQTTIANIPWYAAFVGWPSDHSTFFIPALMLNVNLFSAQIVIILFGLLLPLFFLLVALGPANPFSKTSDSKSTGTDDTASINCGDFHLFKTELESARFRYWVRFYYLCFVLYHSLVGCGVIISTGHSRRHLMAWKVFVPKMIYSMLNLSVVYVLTPVSYFLIMKVHNSALRWKSIHI